MGTHVAAAEKTAAEQPSAGAAAQPDSPTRTGLLIVGASQSGVQLAVSLRALGFDEHITLLGDEDHRPYQRPALSKEFLQGTVESESLIFRSNDYWADHNVALVKGEYIVKIDKDADGSGVANASSGRQFPFKRLALKFHPDTSQVPDAAERMRELLEANNILSDEVRRRAYDRSLGFERPEPVIRPPAMRADEV